MGEFNGWKGQAMKKASDGTWTVRVLLSPGTHGYKFLINVKDWILDPTNANRKTVDGVENSVVEIKDAQSAATPATTPVVAAAASDHAHLDFNVLAERKRFEFDRSGNQHTVTTKEAWGYKVTLEYKSFAPAGELEVEYREFRFDDALRGSGSLIGVGGSTKAGPFATGQKFTFETTPVEMKKFELRPGWYYTDEAKAKVKDRMAGLWIRILRDGALVFEWQSTPDLKDKAKCE